MLRSYGEDTFLISAFARHFVWGMQGRALGNATVVAEPKHYAAHSIPEGGRNTAVSHVGPREMLDTFLPQFEAAVRAGALSIMSAYSEYDGVPCSGSHYLLTQKLRTDFGFQGFVLSDLGAVALLQNSHRVAAGPADAVHLFLQAGGNSQFYDYDHDTFQNAIIHGVADGSLPLSTVNDRVADMLRVRELLQINSQPMTDPSLAARDVNTPEAQALALQLARESIVLLKNEDVQSAAFLPLGPRVSGGQVKKIAVIGVLADQLDVPHSLTHSQQRTATTSYPHSPACFAACALLGVGLRGTRHPHTQRSLAAVYHRVQSLTLCALAVLYRRVRSTW